MLVDVCNSQIKCFQRDKAKIPLCKFQQVLEMNISVSVYLDARQAHISLRLSQNIRSKDLSAPPI